MRKSRKRLKTSTRRGDGGTRNNKTKGSELRWKARECKSERAGRVSVDLSSATGITLRQTGLTAWRGLVLSSPSATANPAFLLPPTLSSNELLSPGKPER